MSTWWQTNYCVILQLFNYSLLNAAENGKKDSPLQSYLLLSFFANYFFFNNKIWYNLKKFNFRAENLVLYFTVILSVSFSFLWRLLNAKPDILYKTKEFYLSFFKNCSPKFKRKLTSFSSNFATNLSQFFFLTWNFNL